MQRNAVKCEEMQLNEEKGREMQGNTEKYREMKRNAEKCRKMQRHVEKWIGAQSYSSTTNIISQKEDRESDSNSTQPRHLCCTLSGEALRCATRMYTEQNWPADRKDSCQQSALHLCAFRQKTKKHCGR